MGKQREEQGPSEMLERILGASDRKLQEQLRDFIHNKSYPLIPGKFIEKPDKSIYNKNEETIRFKPEAETLIRNLFILKGLFKPRQIHTFINSNDRKESEKILETVEPELFQKFNAYRYWFYYFQEFKKLVKEGKLNLEDENLHHQLLNKTRYRFMIEKLPDFLVREKSSLALYTVKLIEELENSANYDEQKPVEQCEKAIYYLRLGSVRIARELIDSILKKTPDYSLGLYVQGLIYLHMRQNTQAEANQAYHTWREYGDSSLSVEKGLQEDYENLIMNIHSFEAKSLEVFLKAHVNWPRCEEYNGKQMGYQESKKHSEMSAYIMNLAFKVGCGKMSEPSYYFDKSKKSDPLFPDQFIKNSLASFLVEHEQSYNSSDALMTSEGKFQSHLKYLLLYRELDQKEYVRYVKKWESYLEDNAYMTAPTYNQTNSYYPGVIDIFWGLFEENFSLKRRRELVQRWHKQNQEYIEQKFRLFSFEQERRQIINEYNLTNLGAAFQLCESLLSNMESHSEKYPAILYHLLKIACDQALQSLKNNAPEQALEIIMKVTSYQDNLIEFLLDKNYEKYLERQEDGEDTSWLDFEDWFGKSDTLIRAFDPDGYLEFAESEFHQVVTKLAENKNSRPQITREKINSLVSHLPKAHKN